jgi:Subtilase family
MKIAIIDSGIHPGHPHVGAVAGAIHVTADGFGDDPADRLGHGTAVAAAIREKAPAAELYAVKVFNRRLSVHIAALLRALAWCRAEGMDLVNLSLGTANPEHRLPLLEAIRGSMTVVSAAAMLPGSLSAVIGVLPDENCPREEFAYRDGVFCASPFPRPIPGVPRARNLQGVSFAVANMTGLAARVLADGPAQSVRNALMARAAHLPETSPASIGYAPDAA